MDLLQNYWGAVVAIVAILGSLWTLAEKLEKKLEQHAALREWVAEALIMPSWHDAYRDWLGRQLEHLRSWMDGLWSATAFARCLAIAFAYPVVLMLFG